jgi:cell division protein ZapE
MQTVRSIYDDRVGDDLRHDEAQEAIIARLDALAADLREASGVLSRLKSRRKAPGGVYIWGDVGRGKSMLVDMFLASVGDLSVRRTHFHAFMRDIHRALHKARATGSDDPVVVAADHVNEGLTLLALDELEITDIVDAMIVGRVFARMFDRGIAVVATSNRPPTGLYQDGLKRDLFVPFVRMIEGRTDVLHLDSVTDYRRAGTFDATCYITPDGGYVATRMDQLWRDLTTAPGRPTDLARTMTVLKSGDMIRADFHTLCRQPLSASDYLDLAETAKVVFLDDVPVMTEKDRDAVRRFILLIDTLYDAGCGLVISAAAAPEDLCTAETFAHEFRRTVSRLHEMCSKGWLGRPSFT